MVPMTLATNPKYLIKNTETITFKDIDRIDNLKFLEYVELDKAKSHLITEITM